MKNTGTLVDKAKLRGGLSSELAESEFFTHMTGLPIVAGYLGSADRNEFRDKAMEAYLKSKGCKPNGVTCMMASKLGSSMMSNVNEQTTPTEFVDLMRRTFSQPLVNLWEILYETKIRTLTPIKGEISPKNIVEVEEGVLLYLRTKQGVKPKAVAAPRHPDEGRFEHTTDGHNKFWEVFGNEQGLFTARWGRIEHGPQKAKEDYSFEDVTRLVREKIAKGYRRVS